MISSSDRMITSKLDVRVPFSHRSLRFHYIIRFRKKGGEDHHHGTEKEIHPKPS
ncbi:hypothetical protein HNQ56_001542 [Anaerotaenia torta]